LYYLFNLETEEVESWKEISAYLDASSRVYGFRVDFVHHNTFKILAALHRAKKTDKEDE
jgi:condensin complex subunit 2